MVNVKDTRLRLLLFFKLHLASLVTFEEPLSVSKIEQVERVHRDVVKHVLKMLEHAGCLEERQARKGKLTDREYVVSKGCHHLKHHPDDLRMPIPPVAAAIDEIGFPARGRKLGPFTPDRLDGGTAVRNLALQAIYDGTPIPTPARDPERSPKSFDSTPNQAP